MRLLARLLELGVLGGALSALGLPTAAAAATLSGTAHVEVDAREASRGVLKVHLLLPVRPGPLTLVYPKWLPGRHSPSGPITDLAGPLLRSGSEHIAWRRDDVDMYAFHLEVPPGASALEADFEVLTSPRPDGLVNGLEAPRTATESLAILEWHQAVLYPEGSNTDELEYQAEVRLPAGWKYATALRGAQQQGSESVRFEPVTLTTLVDSTLLTGRYLESFELGGSPPVRLHVAGDSPVAVHFIPETLEHYRRLVAEAQALYGPAHYRHYDFLYVLTDQIMPDGLEHHESSDNRSPYRTFLDDDVRRAEANLLAHEYTHSWNGKYRRPVGLATRNYQEPMRTELLWVYEGLTEYLGDVLAARSGLLTEEEFRSELAHDFAGLQTHSARSWRSLEDATVAAQLLYVQPRDWAARLRRQEDFYHESALLWLEADTLIRKLSGGRGSLDDFCARFLGGPERAPAVRSYDFDELVRTLEAVQPYDWRRFWQERLQRAGAELPKAGLIQSGWRPELSAEPAVMHRAHEADDRDVDLRFSLGFYVNEEDGTIEDVIPGSPADAAGLGSGDRLIAVNGRKWSRDELHDAVAATARAAHSVTLLVDQNGSYRSTDLQYEGGPREPHLKRIEGSPDLLTLIARPRAAAAH